MKKILGIVTALAVMGGLSFAQELKTATLESPVGKISFGAWGRSTFEIGREQIKTKLDVSADAATQALLDTATTTYDGAYAAVTAAEEAYEAAKEAWIATAGEDETTVNTAAAAVKTTKDALAAAKATYEGACMQLAAGLAGIPSTDTVIDPTTGITFEQYFNLDKEANIEELAGTIAAVKALYGAAMDTKSSTNFIRMNPDWSYGCRVGFWIIGRTNDEHFGFDFNLDSDAAALFLHKLYDSDEAQEDTNYLEDGKYAVAIGDQAKIWGLFDAEPIGAQFKLAFGKMRENVLRGSIGDFGQRESSDVKSEDDIFQEFWPVTGMFASVSGLKDTFLEGFYAAGCVDVTGVLGTSAVDKTAGNAGVKGMDMHDVFHNGQYAIGYTIPGWAQIKAQYWGDSITETNYRYEKSKYQAAREAGFDRDDYYGRMEFGVDFLGLMGGATGLADLDLEKTPNACLIELGVKVPVVTDNDLRQYDPEKFYNWYSCLGTMGVIQKGFILYKAHVWGGQGVSNLTNYTSGLIDLTGDPADILMAGFDALAEVCVNPFGGQNLFVGLSGNWNITKADGSNDTYKDAALTQYKAGAEVYLKKTFAANNFIFAGLAYRYEKSEMSCKVMDMVNVDLDSTKWTLYAPIGIEMFF